MIPTRAEIDRLARWVATRGGAGSTPVAIGAGQTRREVLAGAAAVSATVLLGGLVRTSPARATSASCDGECFKQARSALALADAACDAKAKDLTRHYEFFVDETFVQHQFRILCYQAAQLRITLELGKCRVGCASGRTGARIAQPKAPPIAPPPPPPPPSCPDNTFFCTVGSGGGDICCVNGDSCCSCGICCIPELKCQCCGG